MTVRRLVALATLLAGCVVAPAPSRAAALTEAALCDLAGKASEVKLVRIDDPAGSEARVFDIYGVGTTSANNLVVFGRQVGGYSVTGKGTPAKLPNWRTFRLDKIASIDVFGPAFKVETVPAGRAKIVVTWSCANPASGLK